MTLCSVRLSRKVKRDLCKVPHFIVDKFYTWVDLLENEGILEARKLKSFYDEPLKGQRTGQRFIRLNRLYRAIYVEGERKDLILLDVLEVNKHDD